MKCYVINLARSPERLVHMREVLGSIGVDFERFDAIDIERSKRHPVLPLIPPLRTGRPWTEGELACLLSHYEVWKLIAAGLDPFGAVFEDDLHVDPRLAEIINDPGALPADADIVKLETVNMTVFVSRHETPGPFGVAFAQLLTLHYGAGAYVLSKQTAGLLVRSITSFDLPADDVLFGRAHALCRGLRRYQAVPALVVQDVILPLPQRTLALKSGLEPARLAQREAIGPVRETGLRRTAPYRALRKLVHALRRHRLERRGREFIVPFSSAGKTVAGPE
jgi:glycosyl transferase family 25